MNWGGGEGTATTACCQHDIAVQKAAEGKASYTSTRITPVELEKTIGKYRSTPRLGPEG